MSNSFPDEAKARQSLGQNFRYFIYNFIFFYKMLKKYRVLTIVSAVLLILYSYLIIWVIKDVNRIYFSLWFLIAYLFIAIPTYLIINIYSKDINSPWGNLIMNGAIFFLIIVGALYCLTLDRSGYAGMIYTLALLLLSGVYFLIMVTIHFFIKISIKK
jgi:hypothetical protein